MKYKYFVLRSVNVMIIVLLIALYQFTLYLREKEQIITDLQSQVNQMKGEYVSLVENLSDAEASEAEEGEKTGYEDGTYEGSAEGFGGPITVRAVVKSSKIDTIEIVSADGEDSAYLSMAEDIIPIILKEQTPQVDTVSGATYSSTGIKNAVEAALSSEKKN